MHRQTRTGRQAGSGGGWLMWCADGCGHSKMDKKDGVAGWLGGWMEPYVSLPCTLLPLSRQASKHRAGQQAKGQTPLSPSPSRSVLLLLACTSVVCTTTRTHTRSPHTFIQAHTSREKESHTHTRLHLCMCLGEVVRCVCGGLFSLARRVTLSADTHTDRDGKEGMECMYCTCVCGLVY